MKKDPSTFANRTLIDMLEQSVREHGFRPAVSMALETPLTYRQFYESILGIAVLLKEQGIGRGDKVAILGENSPHWGIAYFAGLHAGAIMVPILPDFPEADVHHILHDSEAKLIFTTQRQLDKIRGLQAHRLQGVIMLDDLQPETDILNIKPITQFIDRAIEFFRRLPSSIGLKPHPLSADELASIIYTSGTSGHSKAVMLTHSNFLSNVLAADSLVDFRSDDTFLSILPLPHTYEFTLGFLLPLFNGARVVYIGKTPNPSLMEKICAAEKPTIIAAVPLIMEKIFKKKVLAALEENRFIKVVSRLPGIKRAIYRKINKKLLAFFGGRLRLMAIGGAALNYEAERFLQAAGFPYLIGYGLTETAPLLAGGPLLDPTLAIGSTGKPIPGVEIKIVDADPHSGIGEIYARGANVMAGYYRNPEATAAVLDDQGWLKTGDLGVFDPRGNLHIKGRSKNMILKADGENIYPEAVEDMINSERHVLESLLLERKGQLEAWVYLDYDLIDAETRGQKESQRLEHIERLLGQLKETLNLQLPAFSKIARFVERKEPFEKTATHKIKRYLYTS